MDENTRRDLLRIHAECEREAAECLSRLKKHQAKGEDLRRDALAAEGKVAAVRQTATLLGIDLSKTPVGSMDQASTDSSHTSAPQMKTEGGADINSPRRRLSIAPGTIAAKCVAVLRDARQPLHADEINNRLEGGPAKKLTVVTTLAILAKDGDFITRTPQPNTFVAVDFKDVPLSPEVTPSGANTARQSVSVTRPVLELLTQNPGVPFEVSEVAKHIQAGSASSINSALQRLAADGKITKIGRGRYVGKAAATNTRLFLPGVENTSYVPPQVSVARTY